MRVFRSYGLLAALACLAVLYVYRLPLAIALGGHLVLDQPLRRADCIIVLAGERGERVTEGVHLYREGYAPRLLLSGGPAEANFPLAEIMKQQAVREGVPARDIMLESRSLDTGEDAWYCRLIMQQRGWRSAILVTSPYHTRRAAAIFAKVFAGTGITLCVHAVPHSWFKPETWWEHKQGIKAVGLEYAKMAWYGLFKQSYQVAP